MSKAEHMIHTSQSGCKISKLFISIMIFLLYECQAITLYLRQGQDAQLNFPYPCDSSQVTLRHGYKAIFYQLTNRSSLSLPEDQANRFKVQNTTINGNCSQELTIRNLKRSDGGTYISSVYKNGEPIVDLTTWVGLQIDYPPGKATCVKVEDKGRNWEAIECTADVGNILGKIECYQDGEKMPPLTDPVETSITLTEIILIRKSEPAFCCSSTFDEYKPQCECNDTVLNLPDEGSRSRDPCPTKSLITTMPYAYNVTENNLTDQFSTMISHTSKKMNEDIWKSVIIHSILAILIIIMLAISLLAHYKMKKTKTKYNHSDNDPPESSESLHDIERENRNWTIVIQRKE